MYPILGTYLILVVDTVATLDDVLLDMPQVDGGRQFPPLLAALCSAPHPDWEVLVNEECLGAGGYPIARLPLPDLRPLQEHIIAWLIATVSGVHSRKNTYVNIPLTTYMILPIYLKVKL